MTSPDKSLTIYVDGKQFGVPSYLSGAQIKALVQKDLQYQLFVEYHGSKPDEVVSDDRSVSLTDGMRFYTVPPAAFGR
jgi:hypothetical protein